VIPGGRAAFAAWWEAYELAGAEQTESLIGATLRADCNTERDRDDSIRTEGTLL
jgi:hypothetical protein